MKKWILGTLGVLLGAILLVVLALGFWPVAPDVPTVGAGGKAGAPSAPTSPDVRGTGQVIIVNPGDSIQAAVDQALPGDTVRVMPGLYQGTVLVEIDSLILEGVVDGAQRATLDGEGQEANGVLAISDYFTISGLRVINYTSNGVTTQGVTGPIFRDLILENTGEYSIFPILSSDILIENNVASGVNDTAYYVGQSRGIIVRNNEAFGSVSGIEIENSVDALVENNYTHDNTAGILVFILPGKTATEGSNTRIVNNRIENNNPPNFSRPEMTVNIVPDGTGVFIMSADTTEVTGNTFTGNKSFAVAIVAISDFPEFFGTPPGGWDIPVRPEGNWIHDNIYTNNGYDADPEVVAAGFIGADLLWSTTGAGNRWDEPAAARFPPLLPGSNWPAFLQRAYQRLLNIAVNL